MTTPPPGQALTAETDAAVEAMRGAIEWDKARGYRMPYRVRDPLYAAIDRLASQSTAPTRGEGERFARLSLDRGAYPDDLIDHLNGYITGGSGRCREGLEGMGVIIDAPTPPEPVASALAEGEGLEPTSALSRAPLTGHFLADALRQVQTDTIVTVGERRIHGENVCAMAADALEAAAARIAELEAEVSRLRSQMKGADRLASASPTEAGLGGQAAKVLASSEGLK